MKVLIACEESQRVCIAFRKLGHEAYSCDIQEPSGGHPEWHILGDALTSIEVCKRLFPGVNLIQPGCRKEHDGMAEALLMALYAKRRL